MENGGRDISEYRKDKYSKKVFNYDEEQLQNIKSMLSNRHDVLDRKKSGKYGEAFASTYKITQNPPNFNGAYQQSSSPDLNETEAIPSRNFHQRAKSMLQ